MSKTRYKVIGLMSGTSLDGMDIAYCELEEENGEWSFDLVKAKTVPYDFEWRKRLKEAHLLSAENFIQLDVGYGQYIGKSICEFINANSLDVEHIASHGHTIFHQPEKGFTCQIGSGEAIFQETGIPLIYDFRSRDVALSGQGAPLVPIGDRLLFGSYSYCLNLGGIANISFEEGRERRAFDICPANMILNEYTGKMGKEYDNAGEIGAKGLVHHELLERLNALDYYKMKAPKSIGREWFETYFLPIFESYNLSIEDALRTAYEHIAVQISKTTKDHGNKMLVTGGGAHNDFLMKLIQEKGEVAVEIPSDKIIDYKEALIFALLGVLRVRNEVNTLSSVTGATIDSSGGIIIT